ncbi:FecR domain-containing protein [Paenibacillus sp. GCM10027626]|uniref:FecR domain-containing protein n=1 Tax=Paenibacillus sp. GCM10027626 TaxID=3273411 RepID=UPI00362D0D99
MKASRGLLVMLCIILFAAMSLADVRDVFAREKRVAVATAVQGTVQVLKSGGSKPFKAFKNMSLNEGDQITTGKNGSIKLELSSSKADQDQVTIGENSQVTFTKLKEDKGAKAKMNIWAGSLWVKVKSVSNASDKFEVETPTSIMGVRGTQFYVSVDPVTEISRLAGFAGVVESTVEHKTSKQGEEKRQFINPTELLVSYSDQKSAVTYAAINKLDDFVQQMSPALLQQLLQDAKSIQDEQQQLVDRWQKELKAGKQPEHALASTDEELRIAAANMKKLLSLLVQEAVKQEKFKPGELESIVAKINRELGETIIDLDLTEGLQLTKRQLEAQERQQRAVREQTERRSKEEEGRKKERDQALADRLLAEKQQRDQVNRQTQGEQRKQAEERYKEQLSPQERAQFERDKKAREQESGSGSGVWIPYPVPGPKPNQANTPAVNLAFDGLANNEFTPEQASGSIVNLNVSLHGFTAASSIYGLQLELEYDQSLALFDTTLYQAVSDTNPYRMVRSSGPFKVDAGSGLSQAESVDQLDHYYSGTAPRLLYSVTKFTGTAAAIGEEQTVIRLPFKITAPGSAAQPAVFKIIAITAVDAAGNVIGGIDMSGSSAALTVKRP